MVDIEIPHVEERGKRYLFFEKLPGLLSWSILLLPFIMSLINPTIMVIMVIAYLLLWFIRTIGLNIRSIQGFKMLQDNQKYNWSQLLSELQTGVVSKVRIERPKWHYANLRRLKERPTALKPDDIVHALIIAAYNEDREVLEPTFQSIIKSQFDMKKVIVVLAYEERGGEAIELLANSLIKEYGPKFMHAMAVKHPANMAGEVIGKGGNITYAARELNRYIEQKNLTPLNVIVTTLDSDNHPHPQYLNALTYLYAVTPDPQYVSYQPVPVYTKNIWDAPAPTRVIATGNTFWNVVLSMRPHMIRNFASHAQSMQTLIDTDYWSVRTIVEDGHQFWRTYFRYDGRHEVYPIYIPIYQDAVLSTTYRRTLKAQFVQLRRWAWGASDIAYVTDKGYFTKNKVNKVDLTFKFLRLLEGHVSWATSPLILAFAAFIPILFNPDNIAANQLPIIANRINRVALVGLFSAVYLSLRMLPPRPKRYKWYKTLFMILQFALFPVTTILYNGLSGLYSQTRLLFGRYMDEFEVTDKAVKK